MKDVLEMRIKGCREGQEALEILEVYSELGGSVYKEITVWRS